MVFQFETASVFIGAPRMYSVYSWIVKLRFEFSSFRSLMLSKNLRASSLVFTLLISFPIFASDQADKYLNSALCEPSFKKTALMIIDMQAHFWKETGDSDKPENAATIKATIQAQIEAIEVAKKAGIPIVIVEMAADGPNSPNYGGTVSELREAVKGYNKTSFIGKTTQGAFDTRNKYRDGLSKIIKDGEIKNFVVMGAHAGLCVASSIMGALKNKCNAVAYSKGIGDWNPDPFIAPFYFDDEFKKSFNCIGCNFKEVDDLENLKNFVTPQFGRSPARLDSRVTQGLPQ